jgi:glycosyltransferase involved in cell wall biosynthesis
MSARAKGGADGREETSPGARASGPARRLTILSVAFPFAPVRLDAVGGAEQVLAQLDAALVGAGHRSVVVACAGSSPAGALLATPGAAGSITDAVRHRAYAAHRRAIERALSRWPVDVIHMHGLDFHAYLPPHGPPVLVTLHLPPEWYPPEVFHPEPGTFLHCVSASQRAHCPAGVRLLPDVPNGVALDACDACHAKRRFAMALGRICPEKGFHLALDAARRAGVPLLLAGQTFPYEAHETYFAREIAPRLDRSRRFIGPIGPARKRRLLSAARCLLVPSLAPETSSLVAMEALACGTPVIAFTAGALPEIVEHGRTGFIVADEQEMAEAIHAAARIDPEVCRRAARERFALEHTIERYFGLYRDLAQLGWTEPASAASAIRPPISAHARP